MELASVSEQQAYLAQCIDPYLEERIKGSVNENTKIFEDNGCIDLLDKEFQKYYPLIGRRLDFFRSKQAQGQLFSDWANNLRALGDEADLASLEVDDLYTMRYLVGVTDPKLLQRFLKKKDPRLADLNDVVYEHEVADAKFKAMQETSELYLSKSEVKSDDEVEVSEVRYKKKGWKSFKQMKLDMQKRKLCVCCGKSSKSHTESECRARQGKCNFCQGEGHWESACFKKKAGHKRASQSHNFSKSKSSFNVAAASESTISYVHLTRVKASANEETPLLKVKVNSYEATPFEFQALPDTGATMTIMSRDIVRTHGIKIDQKKKRRILAANKTEIPCDGTAVLQITANGRSIQSEVLVSSGMHNQIIVSYGNLRDLKIIHPKFPNCTYETPKEVACSAISTAFDQNQVTFEKKIEKYASSQLMEDIGTVKVNACYCFFFFFKSN